MILFEIRRGKKGIESVVQPTSNENLRFQDLPNPTGPTPYHLSLDTILAPEEIRTMEDSGSISFHIAGDTGGVMKPEPLEIVALAMEADFDHKDLSKNPAFFYHLGDVVYKFGEASEYNTQFYEPFAYYPAPIFAIPGNKDGDIRPGSSEGSLAAFVNNFCAKTLEVTPDAADINRSAMVQPNVYWTLSAPFVTIIGLYSNVPDGGVISEQQFKWFKNELSSTPRDKASIVAIHHSPFSVDNKHSGSATIARILDNAFEESGRFPDVVFSAHVHNYQRFTRLLDKGRRDLPYIILGTGGHWKLNQLQKHQQNRIEVPFKLPDRDDITLEQYCDDHHGYMGVQVTPKKLIGKYRIVSRPHESWHKEAKTIDIFELDLQNHKLQTV